MRNPFKRRGRSAGNDDGSGIRVVPLEGGVQRAVFALTAGLRLPGSAWPEEPDDDWPVYASSVALARSVVDAVLGAPGALADAALAAAADAHRERVVELAELLGEDLPGPDHTPDPEDLGFATRALREQALDRHTAEMMVGTHQDGGHVLITHPV